MKLGRLLVGVLIGALVLVSCGSEDTATTDRAEDSGSATTESQDEVVEIVWQAHSTPVYTPEFWDTILERFHEENPDIRVERVMAPDTNADQFVRTLIAADSMPDVVMSINTEDFKEALLPLEIDEDVKRVRNWEAVLIDGKLYSYGAALVPESLVFYNKDLFEEAGIADTPSSIEELEAAMNTFKDMGVTPLIVAGEWVPGRFFSSFFNALNVFDDHRDFYTKWLEGELAIAEEWLPDAQLLKKWVDAGYIDSGGLGDGYQQGEEKFLTGGGAMYPMGVWLTGVLASNPPDFEPGVFAMPAMDGDEVLSARFGRPGISVSANTDQREAAIRFAKFLAFDDWAHPIITERDGLISDLQPPAMYDMTDVQQTIFDLTQSHTIVPTWTGWGDSRPPAGFAEEINTVIQDLIIGNATPETAMAALDQYPETVGDDG
ncbi:MAG TPA: extracellular solute-binding protein [Acidimicrobiia bacterium]|nr:extracellular solute-binding protein [Acidimicrobiia bacterium]